MKTILLLLSVLRCAVSAAWGVELTVDSAQPREEIDLGRYALGQGGLSAKPMFKSHVKQVAELRPQTIRLFVQEYFNLYSKSGRYHWTTLDKSIKTILATGAKPILCLCFKPKALYPQVDQRIVHPNDYDRWEQLIFQLVKHCNQDKKFGIEYWEVANEPDIGEDGGCPCLFEPSGYVTYYTRTVGAVLRADPAAKVGGPALAGYNSDIGKALLEHCGRTETPLHFFSWHIYNNDPGYFRNSIREVKTRLAQYPKLQATETIIDEWNMSLEKPGLEPGFQPAFVLETTLGFFEEGLSRSAYYHIRDTFVQERQFARFLSPKGAAFMAHWWNEVPQYCGLYDNRGRVRPAYSAFKLLSLIQGQRLPVQGATSEVKGFAARRQGMVNVVVWNFAPPGRGASQEITLNLPGLKTGQFSLRRLNSARASNPLELERRGNLSELETKPLQFQLAPCDIRWVTVQSQELAGR